jgi:TolB-like protein/DNA-binding winged helix-turn-helix (wHTH) protein/Flp pilus assembly protein TadD
MLHPATAAATHFPATRTFTFIAVMFGAPQATAAHFWLISASPPKSKLQENLAGPSPLDLPPRRALHSLHRVKLPIQPAGEHQTIRFGMFEADLRAGDLLKNGLRIKIQEKPFQILGLLLERAGEAVTREELREKLWSADTFVDFDHSLDTAMGKLRQALGDSAKRPLFIETLGGRGYRFIAPVAGSGGTPILPTEKPAAVPAGHRKPWFIVVAATASILAAVAIAPQAGAWRDRLLGRPPTIHSLAVLPLEDLARDPDQEYFADGMTDELITDLARIGALRVISRTSTMRYKGLRKPLAEIARELNVDAVVEGTVRRAGGRVRITAQLIQVNPEKHLWTETYERDLRDVLALQEDVASDIAGQIRIKLTPQEQTGLSSARLVDPQAHEAYLKGIYFCNKRTPPAMEKGVGYFNQAIQIDPHYAPAYAELANAYNLLGYYAPISTLSLYPKARAAALQALALDGTLAEAHAALGLYRSHYEGDQAAADRELRRAIELSPGNAMAHVWRGEVLAVSSRHAEALAELDRALELDPTSPMVSDQRGWVFYMAHRYDDAVEQIRKSIELDPRFAHSHAWLGKAYLQKGMLREGLAELQEAVSLPAGDSPLYAPWIAYAYALSGKRAEAYRLIDIMKANLKTSLAKPFGIAVVHCGLKQKDQALAWLEKAHQERDPLIFTCTVEPAFDWLRSDPHFQDLLRRSNLPP